MDNHRKPPGLSTGAEKLLRRTAVAAVFVIALAAAVLSFNGLRNLALEADIPVQLAWIFPIVVDGLTLVGSLGVVHAVLTGLRSWYPWMLTLFGVGMSVWGNVASSPPELEAQIVHAIPPLVLALSLEALLKVYRYRAVVGYMEENADTPEEHAAAAAAAEHAPVPGEIPAWEKIDATVTHAQLTTGETSAITPSVSTSSLPSTLAQTNPVQSGKTTREMVAELIAANPDMTASEVAKALGKDRSNVAKIYKELKASETVSN